MLERTLRLSTPEFVSGNVHLAQTVCFLTDSLQLVFCNDRVRTHTYTFFLYLPIWCLRRLGLRLRGKVFKEFLCGVVQFLYVLFGFVGKCVGSRSAPRQPLGLRVEQIHDEGPGLVDFRRGSCLTEAPSSETTPSPATPAAAVVVVEGVHGVMVPLNLDGHDGEVTTRTRGNLAPALCRQ